MGTTEKPIMVVGVDESDYSLYALKWALDHFFVPHSANAPFKLLLVNAKLLPPPAMGISAAGVNEIAPMLEADFKKVAAKIIEKAKEICHQKSVDDVLAEVVSGDARNVLCESVEKHHASMLVVGTHGYGAIKRAVLGSVSDYCAHHAHCTVMIVKMPKPTHSTLQSNA